MFSDLFSSSRVEPRRDHLHIKVYDCDGPVDRDSIGEAKIKLETVKATGQFDEWVKLPRLFGLKSNGEVHVRMSFTA